MEGDDKGGLRVGGGDEEIDGRWEELMRGMSVSVAVAGISRVGGR